MITVRRAIPADKPALAEFLREAYPGRDQYKFPHRWQWQFEDNPFRENGDLPLWLALEGDRIVGQTAAMVELFKVHQQIRRVGWSVDTVVLPEYRGRRIGLRLQEANQGDHEIFMSLSMSSQNRRIKESLGARKLPALSQMRLRLAVSRETVAGKFATGRDGLQKTLQRSRLDSLGAWGFGQLSRGLWWCRARSGRQSLKRLEIAEVAQFNEEVDRLWFEAASDYDVLAQRTSDYLNWKFCHQPAMHHRRFLARRNGRLCGYLILRTSRPPEPQQGTIVDVFAHPEAHEVITALVTFGVQSFLKAGIRTVRIASSDPRYTQIYRQLGFREVHRKIPVCYAADAATFGKDGGRIFFSYADHDLDQYPLAKA